jgi:hypothetical protein
MGAVWGRSSESVTLKCGGEGEELKPVRLYTHRHPAWRLRAGHVRDDKMINKHYEPSGVFGGDLCLFMQPGREGTTGDEKSFQSDRDCVEVWRQYIHYKACTGGS